MMLRAEAYARFGIVSSRSKASAGGSGPITRAWPGSGTATPAALRSAAGDIRLRCGGAPADPHLHYSLADNVEAPRAAGRGAVSTLRCPQVSTPARED